jgi:peptidoglycan/xylan/chitin deacetylase (PgdA/CDA1 family)
LVREKEHEEVTLFRMEPKRLLRWLWADLLSASGCFWWAKHDLRRNGAVVPLTFHRVLRDTDYEKTRSMPGMVLMERTFRDLASHVAREYETVDLRESKPGMVREKLRVAFTFDDGWIDTYAVAFPIAREYRIPFIVFVCPGLIDEDTPFWPERLAALLRAAQPSAGTGETEKMIEKLKKVTHKERERYLLDLQKPVQEKVTPVESKGVDRTLSWAFIAEMVQHGVSFGSHSQTHPILTVVPADTVRQEVNESKAAIESALSNGCDIFAYPNGEWSPQTREILEKAGFRLAVTTRPGAWTMASDPLAIPRSNICEDNVVGPTGRFSGVMFEYMTVWKAWRATKTNSIRNHHAAANGTGPTSKGSHPVHVGNTDDPLSH